MGAELALKTTPQVLADVKTYVNEVFYEKDGIVVFRKNGQAFLKVEPEREFADLIPAGNIFVTPLVKGGPRLKVKTITLRDGDIEAWYDKTLKAWVVAHKIKHKSHGPAIEAVTNEELISDPTLNTIFVPDESDPYVHEHAEKLHVGYLSSPTALLTICGGGIVICFLAMTWLVDKL